ncbi:RagB/SusD family nutrient uptake outer membrane protein [Sphingobacterium sp. E70]|nr:RagB/SusD family nutrient uptake outer membrane protein [Sphingobacterium sp. E70]ULT23686.1 RagB/SusD family nutrient uptake outer membrane protein [Sphingobacterium sp. E70]
MKNQTLADRLFTKKYVNLAMLPFNRTKTPMTDQNIVHIRYADVLLMYAEAKMK